VKGFDAGRADGLEGHGDAGGDRQPVEIRGNGVRAALCSGIATAVGSLESWPDCEEVGILEA